ncbi:MAG: hypothetical protein IT436_07830 [Phycisphaerales bacterium]|nr:hypothetical protein [Phycisphaerales bacterium]
MLMNAANPVQSDENISAIELLAEGRITRAYFEEMSGARRRGRRLLEAAIDARLQNMTGDRGRSTERHRRPAARPEPAPHQLRLVGSW